MQYAFPEHFDSELENVMNQEQGSVVTRRLQDHPIYNLLADDPTELSPSVMLGGKAIPVTYPSSDYKQEATLVGRVQSIGAFFNPRLTAVQWQLAIGAHPAWEQVVAELDSALAHGGITELSKLMDKLDAAGYLTAFNRSTRMFTINFRENAGVNILDAQKDLKNKQLLQQANGVDETANPEGGWIDPKQEFVANRSLPWLFKLGEKKPERKVISLASVAAMHPRPRPH